MQLFRKLFHRRPTGHADEWVAIHFKLRSGEEFGTHLERSAVHELAERLASLVRQKKVGSYDGDEYGQGQGVLFIHGPNADILYEAISPLLRSWALLEGGYVIKRYGMGVRSERVDY